MVGQDISQRHPVYEFDLVDLLRSFKKQKRLIFSVTIFFAIIGLIFTLLKQPVYEATALLLPPTQDNIESLNYGDSRIHNFTPSEVFTIFTNHLASNKVKELFFNSYFLPSLLPSHTKNTPLDKLYAQFQNTISIQSLNGMYRVSFKMHEPLLATKWIKQYIALAEKEAHEELIKTLRSDRSTILRTLGSRIDIMKAIARDEREDRMVLLTEAIGIATDLGLNDPYFLALTNKKTLNVASNDHNKLYLMGTKALVSERHALKERKSIEPFILKIRSKQQEYNFYKNIEFNSEALKLFNIDGTIKVPDLPLLPTRSLIFSLFCVVGLFIGIGFAFILYSWRMQKGTLYQ